MEDVQVKWQAFLYCLPNYHIKQYLNGNKEYKMDRETFWNIFVIKVEYNEPDEEKSVVYEFDKFGMPRKWMEHYNNGTRNSWLGTVDNILKIYDYYPICNLKQGTQTQFQNVYQVREKLREWEKELVYGKYE